MNALNLRRKMKILNKHGLPDNDAFTKALSSNYTTIELTMEHRAPGIFIAWAKYILQSGNI